MAEEKKKRKSTKPPTAKQLRARAKFIRMVKQRAKAAKAAKRAAGIKSKPKSRKTVAPKRKTAAKKSVKRNPKTMVMNGKRRKLMRKNIAGFIGADGQFHPIRSGMTPSGRPAKKPYSPKRVGEKSAYSTKGSAKRKRGHKQALKGQRSLTAGTSLKQRAISNPKGKATHEGIVKAVRELGHLASPYYLRQLGYTKREVEAAVRAGKLKWNRDGSVSIANPGIRSAKKQFKEFAGRSSRKVSTNYAPKGSKAPKNVSAMGKLKKVFVKGRAPLNFSAANATLARSGNKMFVLGKGYTLGHIKGRKRNPDGFEDLGEITRLEYECTKTHLGDSAPVTYFHKMGEEGGEKPHAVVNSEGLLIIDGGTQWIDRAGIHD